MKSLKALFASETTSHAVKWLLVLDLVAVLVASGFIFQTDALGLRAQFVNAQAAAKPLLSRQVVEYTEKLVRDLKPTPPDSSREYAYVASAYSGVLETDGQAGALAAAQVMIDALFPADKLKTKSAFDAFFSSAGLVRPAQAATQYVTVQQLLARLKTDGSDLAWDHVIPTGPNKWVRTTADPFAPRAGDWKRWDVSGSFDVPPPPQYGSATDSAELAGVRTAVAQRDGSWIAKINFWGGTPGTNAPSGIWQDQFYKTILPDLTGSAIQRDRSYAYGQKILAQTMADAFMECWKVKYTYWSARPDMRDPSIKTAMADPIFPGYVSGHSTVSKAAAEVLAVMAPAHAEEWRQMAVDARQSRLYAGIHFDVDNRIGFSLGSQIATQVITKRKLGRVF
jgi:hypothetical protein